MTKDSLSDLLARMQPAGAGFTAPIPERWTQGRTTFGGLTAALMLQAAMREQPDLPPLRSALIGFTAPVTEPPLLTSQVLRRGRNVTTIEARAQIGEQVVCTGNFSFGAAQQSSINVIHNAPPATPPEQTMQMIPPEAVDMAPGFHKNFDIRLIEGDRPMSGSNRPYIRAWARHKDPASQSGIVSLLCLADILPPAVFPMFPRPGPNSSMSWICNFLTDAPQTKDGWWHVETSSVTAHGGYSSQVMRMWNSEGELMVEGMQSVVVFV